MLLLSCNERVLTASRSQAEEVCEGGQLGKLVQRASWSRRGKRLYSYADAARWSEQAAKALHYLHSVQPQVLHRDVKASNLLLTRTGRAGDIRLSDFGLIKLRSASPAVVSAARRLYRAAVLVCHAPVRPSKARPPKPDVVRPSAQALPASQAHAALPHNMDTCG